MPLFSGDDMETSTFNISGYAVARPTALVCDPQIALPVTSVSTPDAQSFRTSPFQESDATAMQEDTWPLQIANNNVVLLAAGYALSSIGQVLSAGSCATGQTLTNPPGQLSANGLATTLQVSVQPQIITADAGSDIGTPGEEVASDDGAPASPSRPTVLRKSVKALTRHCRSSPNRRPTSLMPLPADLEALKHTLDDDLGRDYWMAELGRIPFDGVLTPLQTIPRGSVPDDSILMQTSPKVPLSVVYSPDPAKSDQSVALPARDFNVHVDRDAAKQTSTPPAISSVLPSCSLYTEAKIGIKSNQSVRGVACNGNPTPHESDLPNQCPPTTLQASAELTFPSANSTAVPVSTTTRPTRKESPAIIPPYDLMSRNTVSSSNQAGYNNPRSPINGSSGAGESKTLTSPMLSTIDLIDLTSETQLPSRRASESQKLRNKFEPAPLLKQVTVLRKEATKMPWTPSESLKQVTAKESSLVDVDLDSCLISTPWSSHALLSPLDDLNTIPRPLSLPKFVKDISLSPMPAKQYPDPIPNVASTVPSDSRQKKRSTSLGAGHEQESTDNPPPNVLGLSPQLKCGKLRSALDLTVTWEIQGSTAPWYVRRTEQLTREVSKGIENCYHVTMELIQRFKQSLLKLDLLIFQHDALCDVLRELHRTAEETHKCRGGCRVWHKNHNKQLKKLKDRVDMYTVLITSPISPSKRVQKTSHFLYKLRQWVETLQTSLRTSVEPSEAVKPKPRGESDESCDSMRRSNQKQFDRQHPTCFLVAKEPDTLKSYFVV